MATGERVPFDLALEVREGFAELRTRVGHLESELSDLRQESRSGIRRLDGRLFQLLVLQVATLATMLGALVASLAS